MPASFRILPEHGLVYVRLYGHIWPAESLEALRNYLRHPDFRPGQKQLIDMGGIEVMERDFTGLAGLQAEMAGAFLGSEPQVLMAFLAPTPMSQFAAAFAARPWEPFDHFVARVLDNETAAFDFLGLTGLRLSDLEPEFE